MWIEEWRRKNGVSRKELGKRAKCSPVLISMLETMNACVTHPRIADRIVAATGGTAEQRDSIVAKEWRGKPSPPAPEMDEEYLSRAFPEAPAPRPRRTGKRVAHNARAVVQLDRNGTELGRFAHVQEAAMELGLGDGYIRCRCRRVRTFGWAFKHGYTFRFADEWDAMSPEERLEDLARETEYNPVAREIVALNRYGTEVGRYASASKAAHLHSISEKTVKTRCHRDGKAKDEFKSCGCTFRYADEWDAMNAEERQNDIPGMKSEGSRGGTMGVAG